MSLTTYYGEINYFATGEGNYKVFYIGKAVDKEEFKRHMVEKCNIDQYYAFCIEIFDTVTEDTPALVVQYFKAVKEAGAGWMKFETYLNFS